ncbi:hypothetical protein HMPREF1039_0855 [Megasphaera lornae]|uniref:Integrase catalytic domain-containing protein n=1 Tax=Megasphaera lornae TaxID=1000568 RepID=A0ABP2L608_9FIRM|nr:hypothetical protein [Megasphaera lornae]EGL42346.1 hypothetical protein HMPREF1039_0855 [Megasphaera lornae]
MLKIVKEKSPYETSKYLVEIEEKMGFPIRMIQVDNGYEFVNDEDRTAKDSAFEKIVKALHMELRRTGPYAPWQNGNVARSHREDGKILYGRKVFTSEQELIRQVAKHEAGYNKTVKTSLNLKILTKLCRNTFQSVTYILTTDNIFHKIN